MATSPRETLSLAKQLIVEGKDAESFFRHFVEHIGLKGEIQVHDFQGNSELSAFLKQFVRAPEFRIIPVTSLAIIRDAESSASSAFQSVCTALQKAGLPVPRRPAQRVGDSLGVSVFILPDGESPGMIESLVLRAVAVDPVFPCVNQYLECVQRSLGSTPQPLDKARLLAFLSSRPDIKPLLGHAARAQYLELDSEVYEPLKTFLHNI